MSDQNIHATRLRSIVAAGRKMRNAQKAFFSLPKTMSPETKAQFVATAKAAEGEFDGLLKQVEFEKLV